MSSEECQKRGRANWDYIGCPWFLSKRNFCSYFAPLYIDTRKQKSGLVWDGPVCHEQHLRTPLAFITTISVVIVTVPCSSVTGNISLLITRLLDCQYRTVQNHSLVKLCVYKWVCVLVLCPRLGGNIFLFFTLCWRTEREIKGKKNSRLCKISKEVCILSI